MDRNWLPAELTELLGGWMEGDGPLYRRLAGALGRAVAVGDLQPGERLPAERALADALRLSRSTVAAAYEELRGPGVLVSRRGSGTRVAHRPGRRPPGADGRVPGGLATSLVQRLVDGPKDGPDDTISLANASGGAAPPVRDLLRTTLREVLEEDLEGLLGDGGYHPRGLPALREAVAGRLTRAGLPTGPGQVLITTGATQALALAARLYLGRRDIVLVERPSWPGCLDAFHALGAVSYGVPLDDEGLRPDALATALAETRASLLYVMPTYQNPTGVLMSEHRRRRLAETAARHGVPVVEDLAYDAGLGTAPVPAPVGAYARPGAEVLTVGSLAKAVWGGLRIGWVRGPAEAIERLARFKTLSDLGGPLLDQALAVRLLRRLPEVEEDGARLLRERMRHLERRLTERLPEWSWRSPAGGSALWVRLPGDTDAGVYAQVALRHGVEVVPGAATDPDGAHRHHIRVPCGMPAPRLDELVSRLHAAWHAR